MRTYIALARRRCSSSANEPKKPIYFCMYVKKNSEYKMKKIGFLAKYVCVCWCVRAGFGNTSLPS